MKNNKNTYSRTEKERKRRRRKERKKEREREAALQMRCVSVCVTNDERRHNVGHGVLNGKYANPGALKLSLEEDRSVCVRQTSMAMVCVYVYVFVCVCATNDEANEHVGHGVSRKQGIVAKHVEKGLSQRNSLQSHISTPVYVCVCVCVCVCVI